MHVSSDIRIACTVGGSDSGGLAGVQADLKTFEAHGVFATMALTCVTVQNPQKLYQVQSLAPELVAGQLRAVLSYFTMGALKTGLLGSWALIKAVTEVLESYPEVPLIVDPVMVNSLGEALIDAPAIRAYTERLMPQAELITPNLDEAAILLGGAIETVPQMIEAAHALRDRFETSVLLKGGHLKSPTLVDIFVASDGQQHCYEALFLDERNTRGSGCTLCAAITALRARGATLLDAISQAHTYLQQAISQPILVQGEACIHHAARMT